MPSRPELPFATFVISVISLLGIQACRSEHVLSKAEPEQRIVRAKGFGPLTLSVQFPGGPVKEYVNMLKQAASVDSEHDSGRRFKYDINVVVESEVGEIKMPPLSLENTSLGSALQLIAVTAAAKDSKVIVQSMLEGEPGNEVFVVTIDKSPQSISESKQGVDTGKK